MKITEEEDFMSYDNTNNKKGSGVGAALGAVVVGAAVGAAAAYLSDKDKRDKLMNKAKNAADTAKMKASDTVSTVADKTGDALEKAGRSVKSNKSKTETITDELVDTTNETIF
ncbi:MAG: hypothetical protein M3Q44_02865 [bacterium]|nr:hypothetical protein [bacterium]